MTFSVVILSLTRIMAASDGSDSIVHAILADVDSAITSNFILLQEFDSSVAALKHFVQYNMNIKCLHFNTWCL